MNKFDRTLIPAAPDLSFEIPIWEQGFYAAGLDEAGRGAWAGPVIAAVVMLPKTSSILTRLAGVRDSKELKPDARARLAKVIHEETTCAVGMASCSEIDALGILPATRLAMTRALQVLVIIPDILLLDALFLPEELMPQISLIKGDQRCLSIAAASILAKTARDTWMIEAAVRYPGYDFERHNCYGTRRHREALAKLAPCAIHRLSFKPIN